MLEKFLVRPPEPRAVHARRDVPARRPLPRSRRRGGRGEARRAGSRGRPGGGTDIAIVADYSKSLALWEDILKRFPQLPPDAVDALPARVLRQDQGRAPVAPGVPRARVRESLQVERSAGPGADPRRGAQARRDQDAARSVRRLPARIRAPRPSWSATPGSAASPTITSRSPASSTMRSPRTSRSRTAATTPSSTPSRSTSSRGRYYKRDFLLGLDQAVRRERRSSTTRSSPTATSRPSSCATSRSSTSRSRSPIRGRARPIPNPSKAFERARDFYKGRENEPHVRDVWVAMGHAFGDLQAWDQAVDSYQIAIGPPWELNPHEPGRPPGDRQRVRAQGRQVRGRCRGRRARHALRAGHRLVRGEREGPRGDGEPAPDRRARALRGDAATRTPPRRSCARTTRPRAKKDAQAKQDYLAMYGKAVDLYRQFITTYPESRLHLRVHVPRGRGAVLERALPRGDRRSTRGSAITAISAPRTTSTRRARSCSRTRPRRQARSPRASCSRSRSRPSPR